MTKAIDDVTLHQLLGRIVYFHTLFIDPVFVPAQEPGRGGACCNHRSSAHQRTAYGLLATTAWTALDEIAATLSGHHTPCPHRDGSCCATCRVATAGAAIADAWIITEHRAYQRQPPVDRARQVCRTAAAARLAHPFAAQHAAACPALASLGPTSSNPLLPSPEDLPLTGELFALWQDPLSTAHSPVVSWLNHCTALDDVHRVLETRRNNR
ncbi:hypothetical protein GCM10010495_10810 [Kitasatospora herbaricolor]|uniref:hypothetical protein n=1 Tax=Kitasatospora herbaricolor TaxID=68217 RepID=UPI00174BEAF6|nr:hypothetical protein [Kitasatospora herbaricolor]MDQ0309483.1 hypothetical protein [Kitasatospora herbaricolor]GGV01547.1 hypothetical protein GCM10010495_10810 [Kitasatospora herbaricolor]